MENLCIAHINCEVRYKQKLYFLLKIRLFCTKKKFFLYLNTICDCKRIKEYNLYVDVVLGTELL